MNNVGNSMESIAEKYQRELQRTHGIVKIHLVIHVAHIPRSREGAVGRAQLPDADEDSVV
jgi:hypothetical protein